MSTQEQIEQLEPLYVPYPSDVLRIADKYRDEPDVLIYAVLLKFAVLTDAQSFLLLPHYFFLQFFFDRHLVLALREFIGLFAVEVLLIYNGPARPFLLHPLV